MRRAVGLGAATALVASGLAVGIAPPGAAAASSHPAAAKHASGDVRHDAQLSSRSAKGVHFSSRTGVGEVRAWPAMAPDSEPSLYLKDFRLRALGQHVEVWTPVGDAVSTGLDFPAGDCRNGALTTVTDAQARLLADTYDTRILPKLTSLFGPAAHRDGKSALLPREFSGVPTHAYEGSRLVVLVDNFRDGWFYDQTQSQASGIGYVDPVQMDLVDRNVVDVRGVGWAWRLGASPSPDQQLGSCGVAKQVPYAVEGTLAHEYTHVLQDRPDSDGETSIDNDPEWVQEGLAEWATTQTGLVDAASTGRTNLRVQCFLGALSTPATPAIERCDGGPENSLTQWRDGSDAQPADYGAATTFMALLADRYGTDLLRDLLRTGGVWGRDKLAALLQARHADETVDDLVEDWAVSVALDGVLDDGATLLGGDADRYQVDALHSAVAWDSPRTASRPGVSQNATSYVRLRDAAGAPLGAAALGPLDLHVDQVLDCRWSVDPDGHGTGNAALWSSTGNLQDRALDREVTVPAGDPTLDFAARWDTEESWDFAYTQVSTDGGHSWTSVPTTSSTSQHDQQAEPRIVADLPGLTGSSDGWQQQHADLSRWAGQTVRLAFRYRTDPAVSGDGFWVDDVRVGGALVSDGSSLDGWHLQLPAVYDVSARLVSYTADHRLAAVHELPLDANGDVHLDAAALAGRVAPGADTVAVLVTHLRPETDVLCLVRYALTVNGVRQQGG